MLANNAVNQYGNYFTVPRAVYQIGLSMGAIATYGYLSLLENRQRGDKDRYTCHPSYAAIGDAIGRSSRSVAKYVQELVEAGLILTEPTSVTTKDGQKWNGNLKYTLLDPQRPVDLFNERQLAKLDAGVQKKRKLMDVAEKKRERKQLPHAEYIAAKSKHEPEELPL